MFSHKNRLILGIISGLVIISGGVFFFYQQTQATDLEITSYKECVEAGNPVLTSYPSQCRTPEGQSFTQYIGNELEMMDVISIENPRPNQEVSSPLLIKGRARGMYFFEGTFPIRLVDSTGEEIASGFVEAEPLEGEDMMTEDFVPFVGELEFTTDVEAGTLYLESANPSGLSEHDQHLEVPVIFSE